MKRFFSLLIVCILIFPLACPVLANTTSEEVYFEECVLENGLRMVDSITVHSNNRASIVSAERKKSIYDGDTLVAYIRFVADFRYDGSTVSVVSKTITNTNTYDGWSYAQNSFTSSGGTVTLNAKITKWLIFNTPFTMTLSCDKNGNISYS